MTTYSDSGVDIEKGDDASKIMYEAAKSTWENRKGKLGEVITPFDDFSGVRVIDVSTLPEGTVMCMGFDGVGTKVEIAERINKHDTIAHDLFAMVCDDAVIRGGEPVLLGSILDVNKVDVSIIKQLAKGYVEAAKAANVAVINGEIAELGNRIGGFGDSNYNWGAGLIWFAKKDRMFTGFEIKEGDSIVTLKEEGFRSNGLSLVRKILVDSFGENWHEDRQLAESILHPSKIYSSAIVEMFGGVENEPKAEIHGVAHITGGGVPGKLARILKPSGLGAKLDNLFEPCKAMQLLMEKGNVPKEEAYKTWNMGNGMLVVCSEDQADKVIEIAKKHRIEAKVAGKVIKENEIIFP